MTSSEHRSCSTHRLSELTLGRLDDGARQELERHVAACPACQEDLGWLAGVDRLLGGEPRSGDQHPGSAELASHAAGELPAGRQAEVDDHLAACLPCRRLASAARAGLDELARLDDDAAEVAPAHRVLALPPPPALRAAAADGAAPSPAPEDRRVLDEAHTHRLVYFRRGAVGLVGLFYEPDADVALQSCTLEGEALALEQTAQGTLAELGPAAALFGKTVGLRYVVDQQARELSWTVVREA